MSDAVAISVGNLSMGGRGKTPVAMHLARLLLEAGERPAVLSRGYGRRNRREGVVVVSDGTTIRGDLDESGDEPMLIARTVPGAAVLVAEQRAIAAALARSAFQATVHVLDDGFQHRAFARDADLVIVTPHDLTDRRVPFGRLREPVRALARADAVIVDGAWPTASETMPDVMRTKPVFTLRRMLGAPVPLELGRAWLSTNGPAVAVAGIADPDRFTASLQAAGWEIVRSLAFPDHYRYRRQDVDRIARVAHEAGVNAVVTTEKDAMRLLPLRPLPVPIAAIPLDVSIEPAAEFRSWLLARIAEARSRC